MMRYDFQASNLIIEAIGNGCHGGSLQAGNIAHRAEVPRAPQPHHAVLMSGDHHVDRDTLGARGVTDGGYRRFATALPDYQSVDRSA